MVILFKNLSSKCKLRKKNMMYDDGIRFPGEHEIHRRMQQHKELVDSGISRVLLNRVIDLAAQSFADNTYMLKWATKKYEELIPQFRQMGASQVLENNLLRSAIYSAGTFVHLVRHPFMH